MALKDHSKFKAKKLDKECLSVTKDVAQRELKSHLPLSNYLKANYEYQPATKELRAMGVVCKIVGVTSCENTAKKEAFKHAGLDILHERPLSLAKVNSILGKP
ncbi:hypothetical protein Ddye_012134 [Dipteronia dyeriana]|uniref:Uncharacterized protein n=1 Tax=Dipteronia dyeriana TaxID=168575 RepID=A0AAD9X3R8_9ROSI|nr:hypothetical protein Ddye_012134 [Dipteronia dyeriana]